MTDANKFNEKVYQLLNFLKQLYPSQTNELNKAETVLSTAVKFNHRLPSTIFYQRLSEPLKATGTTLLEEIQKLPDVTSIELENSPLWQCIPYMDKIDKQLWIETKKPQKRRVWAYLRELVLLSGHTLQPRPVLDPMEQRAVQFNLDYDSFLQNMLIVCPLGKEAGLELLDQFRRACSEQLNTPSVVCLRAFREAIMPHIGLLLSKPNALLINTPDLYAKLPYIQQLPLETYWRETVLENPNNQDQLMQKMIGLVQSCVGLNFLGPEAIQKLTATTERHLEGVDLSEFQNIQNAAMSMFAELKGANTLQNLCEAASNNLQQMDRDVIEKFAISALPSEFHASAKGYIGGKTGEAPFGN